MNRPKFITALGLGVALVLPILHGGCRIDSADSVSRNVGVNVNGLYRNNGSRVVSRNSGAAITQFNIIQDGGRLQAIDNNGQIFRGDIGSVSGQEGTGRSATFTLQGETTVGAEAVITGTFTVNGGQSIMQGTWAEPAMFGTVTATAASGPQPDDPDPDPDPDPDNNITTPNANLGIQMGNQ